MAFLERKIQLLPLNKVIVWNDGMGVQFHSRFVFILLSKCDLTKSREWHWNTAHGKGLIDGIGGTMKNLCCRAMKSEKNSKNTRRVYQCSEFTNTIIINLFANNRLLREPPEEANAPPIPEKLQM